jgi:hypothetical protein
MILLTEHLDTILPSHEETVPLFTQQSKARERRSQSQERPERDEMR